MEPIQDSVSRTLGRCGRPPRVVVSRGDDHDVGLVSDRRSEA